MSDAFASNFNARAAVLLGLILVLAAGLRLWNIGKSSFWLDEYLTVSLSSGHGLNYENLRAQQLMDPPPDLVHLEHADSIASIWTQSAHDIHPPLFYVLLRLWRMIVPDTEGWMRALPALFSLVAIVLLFLAVSAVGGTTSALWAALLMAMAGPQIQYAQENRSYTLLLATLLGACAALLWIERSGLTWPRTMALALCTLAAAMTHYAALPLIACLGLYTLIRLRGNALKGTLGALLTAGILYALIWGPFAWKQLHGFSTQTGFTNSDPRAPQLNELLTLALLPLRFFSTTEKQTTEIGYLGAVLYLLPLLLLRRRPGILFWWMWLVVGVGVVAMSDLARNGRALYWIRYTLAASPAAYALAAMLLAHLSGWTRHLVPMTLALSSILALEGAYDPTKPRWRDVGRYLDTHLQIGDVLVIADLNEAPWVPRSDLIALNFYVHTPVATAILDQPPSGKLGQRLESARRIWVFTDGGRSAAAKLFPNGKLVEGVLIYGVGTIACLKFTPDAVAPVNDPAAPANPASTAPSPVARR